MTSHELAFVMAQQRTKLVFYTWAKLGPIGSLLDARTNWSYKVIEASILFAYTLLRVYLLLKTKDGKSCERQ